MDQDSDDRTSSNDTDKENSSQIDVLNDSQALSSPSAEINGISPVLLNPLVQSHIFGFLPPSGLKVCRLVCQDWKSVATSCLTKCTRFSIKNFFTGWESTSEFLPPCDEKLYRRVLLKYNHTVEKNLPPRDNIGHKFDQFLILKGTLVQDVKFDVDPHFFFGLKKIFEKYTFSRLTALSLHERHHLETFHSPGITTWACSEMNNLRTLEISTDEDRPSSGTTFHPLLQLIIDKAPNLEELKIVDNFYPDLSKCVKLKSVDWSGFPYEIGDDEDEDDEDIEIRPDFSLNKVFAMLAEVTASLEKLVLGSSSSKLSGVQDAPIVDVYDVDDFKLPKFANLREFNFDAANVYDIALETLTQKHFPALRKLRFGEDPTLRGDRYLFQVFTDISTTCASVEELSIVKLFVNFEYDNQLDELPQIAECMPNLKVLDVMIVTTSVARPENESVFKECFNMLGNFFGKLDHLIIRLDWKLTLQQLIRITGLPQFHGLKSLKLVNLCGNVVQDDGSDFEDKTFPVIGRVILENFTFKLRGDSGSRLVNFVEKHNGNVIFIN